MTQVPTIILEIDRQCPFNPKDPWDVVVRKLSGISVGICNLRAAVKHDTDGKDAVRLVQWGKELSDMISQWEASLIPFLLPIEILPGTEDAIINCSVASTYAHVYLMHMMVHETILDKIEAIGDHSVCDNANLASRSKSLQECQSCLDQIERSQDTIRALIERIFNSIEHSFISAAPVNAPPFLIKFCAGAIMPTLWPFYVIGSSALCPPRIRARIIDKFAAHFKNSGHGEDHVLASLTMTRNVQDRLPVESFVDLTLRLHDMKHVSHCTANREPLWNPALMICSTMS